MTAESSPQESSEAPKTVTSDAPAQDGKETSAAMSTADQSGAPDKGEVKLLDRVKAALKPEEKSPVSAEPDPKSEAKPSEAGKEPGDEGGDSDDLTEEELARLKPKTAKRMKTLLAERAERDKQIADLSPKAQQFDQIVRFVEEANLAPSEVNQLFDIGRDLKLAPRKAYEAMRPTFEALQRAFGDVLPDDLQQQVAIGAITAEAAKALATSRTEAALARQNAERMQERETKRQKGEAESRHVEAVKAKVTEWENSKAKADPDWNLKQPLVQRAIKLAIHERGYPPSPEEAVKLSEEALKSVDEDFKRLAPKRKEVTPVIESASPRATTKPTSALEAAKAGLARMDSG